MRAACLIVLLSLAPRAEAARAIDPPAPEFPPQAVWINARDMSLARLRGRRVVLVAFLNTMNMNSRRAVAALKLLDQRYALDGLMVIGVHTPEFAFQKNPAALKQAFAGMGVQFPVVVDNDRLIWKAYANDGWPAFYLVDRKGRIVFDRLGEGGYEELENNIRSQLESLTGAPPSGGPPALQDPPPVGGECGEMTPEVALGSRRGGKIVDLDAGDIADNLLLTAGREGEISTRGRWLELAEDLRVDQQNADQSAFTRVIYRGAQGFGVLGPGDLGPTKFWLKQDDLWLDSSIAGKDVRFDPDKRSYALVDAPRFYDLVRNPNDNMHVLTLTPMRRGGRIYGFSFNNQCLLVK